jgi:hypothetical protein
MGSELMNGETLTAEKAVELSTFAAMNRIVKLV